MEYKTLKSQKVSKYLRRTKAGKPSVKSLQKKVNKVSRILKGSRQDHFYDVPINYITGTSWGGTQLAVAAGTPPVGPWTMYYPMSVFWASAPNNANIRGTIGTTVFVTGIELRLYVQNNYNAGSTGTALIPETFRCSVLIPKDKAAFVTSLAAQSPPNSLFPWDYTLYRKLYVDEVFTLGNPTSTTAGGLGQQNSAPSQLFIRKHLKINKKFNADANSANALVTQNDLAIGFQTDSEVTNIINYAGNCRIYFKTES